jgi:hypothetical protein
MARVEMSGMRHGLTVIEVAVIALLIAVVACFLLMGIPYAREQARLAGCRRNLGQIGVALALHDQTYHRLPTVSRASGLQEARVSAASSPLALLLETLQLPDLTELNDPQKRPPVRPGEVPGEVPVAGFVCASDPNATTGRFPAPISYRAVTGDSAAGDNGIFAPGRVTSMRQIEAGDGLSYTAAFSERLVGNGVIGHAALANYEVVSGSVPSQGCPVAADRSAWRGDAGSSWRTCNYRSTLYNHALKPNGHPSCVALDGQTAYMGASSGHVSGVHVLSLDGSVSVMRPTIDLKIWRELARVNDPSVLESEGP